MQSRWRLDFFNCQCCSWQFQLTEIIHPGNHTKSFTFEITMATLHFRLFLFCRHLTGTSLMYFLDGPGFKANFKGLISLMTVSPLQHVPSAPRLRILAASTNQKQLPSQPILQDNRLIYVELMEKTPDSMRSMIDIPQTSVTDCSQCTCRISHGPAFFCHQSATSWRIHLSFQRWSFYLWTAKSCVSYEPNQALLFLWSPATSERLSP